MPLVVLICCENINAKIVLAWQDKMRWTLQKNDLGISSGRRHILDTTRYGLCCHFIIFDWFTMLVVECMECRCFTHNCCTQFICVAIICNMPITRIWSVYPFLVKTNRWQRNFTVVCKKITIPESSFKNEGSDQKMAWSSCLEVGNRRGCKISISIFDFITN